MFNSRNLGALVVKQDPQVLEWEDARYGIQECLMVGSFTLLMVAKAATKPGFPPVPGLLPPSENLPHQSGRNR